MNLKHVLMVLGNGTMNFVNGPSGYDLTYHFINGSGCTFGPVAVKLLALHHTSVSVVIRFDGVDETGRQVRGVVNINPHHPEYRRGTISVVS